MEDKPHKGGIRPRSRPDLLLPPRRSLRNERRTFLPNRILAAVQEGGPQRDLARRVPLVEGKTVLDARATAYVCERRVCDLPTTDPAVLVRQLARVAPLPDAR